MGTEWTSPRKLAREQAFELPEALQAIERWPAAKMTAPNKLAFYYLYRQSRGGLDRLSVSGTMVGEAQGASGDAGTDRLDYLQRVGLVTVVHRDKQTGRWLLEINDPLEVARAIRRAGDPQRLFDFLDELEPSSTNGAGDRASDGYGDRAEVNGDLRSFPSVEAPAHGPGASSGGSPWGSEEAPEDPPARLLSETSERINSSLKLSTIGKPSVKTPDVRALGAGGSSGGTSEAAAFARTVELRRSQQRRSEPPAPPAVAQVLRTAAAVVAKLPNRQQQEQEAEALCKLIMDRVNDPKFRESPAIKLAWHVVEGRIPRALVIEALHNLDEHRRAGTLNTSPGRYFVGARDKLYQTHGIPLPKELKPR